MAMISTLMDAPFAVQAHVASIAVTVLLAPLQIFRRGRDHLHKVLGYVWVVSMAIAALSSFLILDIRLIGPFSPIHLLSIYVLWGLWQSTRAAIRGDIATHKAWMQNMVLFALIGAGMFTFAPGRLMNRLFFSQMPLEGFLLAIGCGVAVFVVVYGRRYLRRARAA